MSDCNSRVVRVTTVSFNGINHDPIDKTATLKLGGPIAADQAMTAGGKYYGTVKVEPGEIEFEIPLVAGFNADNYRNKCGDLMMLMSDGVSYLMTNAQTANNIEIKDGEGKVKLSFKGDPAVLY